jgi:eukaryotic-like serine/threonine-protein kinase
MQCALPVEELSMIGKTLGHYRILEKTGQGGMGEVFLADDTSLHRKVALNFLPPEMQQDVAAHKRFIREARATAALDHPLICHINEVAEYEGKDFVGMEYSPRIQTRQAPVNARVLPAWMAQRYTPAPASAA